MNNSSIPGSPQEFLRSVNILHLAMLAGQIMIFSILYFVLNIPEVPEDSSSLVGGFDGITGAFMTLFGVLAGTSFFFFNKRKKQGQNLKGSLKEKLVHYRASFLLSAALLEGANLTMLIVYFFVSKKIALLVLFAIGVALFLLIRPTANRIIEDYQLSASEQNQLRSSLR